MTQIQKDRVIEVYDTRKDLTNKERTKLLNDEFGVTYSDSTYRKYYAAFVDGRDSKISDEQVLQRMAKSQERLMVEQKKNTLIKQNVHKGLKENAMYELIREKINGLDLSSSVDWSIEVMNKYATADDIPEVEIDIVIADLHYKGQEDDEHVKRIFKLINHIQEVYQFCDKINLNLLGDDIEGTEAHMSQLLEVRESGAEQTARLIPLLIKGINQLDPRTNINFVTHSNHGQIRSFGTSRGQFPNNDFGTIIGAMLKDSLDSKDRTINVAPIIETEHAILMHGDKPIAKSRKTLVEHFGNKKDIYMGHFHNFKSTTIGVNKHLMVFPSCKNTQYQYEKEAGYEFQPPKITTVKRVDGKIQEVQWWEI